MRIETMKGKYGKDDKIILFSSTDKNGTLIEEEAFSIFKLCLLVNQLAFNELRVNNGFKKKLLNKGKSLFFEEAIKEAIEMAKNDISWAEPQNWQLVKEWAKNWRIHPEKIERELRRTFQKRLDEF